MSVSIKLRNGRVLEARSLEGDLFEATLASGKTKIYALTDLLSVDAEDLNQEEVITNKEDKMTIHHYLQQFAFGKEDKKFNAIVRMVTTELPASVTERYAVSAANKRVEGGVFALNTGTWQFGLLENTLIKSGDNFTLMIMSNEDVQKLDVLEMEGLINRSNFAYANASYTFFFRVNGQTNFGLEKLGISIEMAKKSAKRLQELFRQSEMCLMLKGDEMDSIDFAFPELAGDEKFYDGKTYIRKSLALRLAYNISNDKRRHSVIRSIKNGHLVQVVIRIMTPNGLLKGDAIIVPDNQLSAHVVSHLENVKSEMLTDDYIFITMWEHAPVHMAVWDDQSAVNFGHALSEQAHVSDIFRMVNVIRKNIADDKLPEWLIMGESSHNDDGTLNMEQLSDTINKSWIRWQAHDLPVRAAQNLMYMALGGVVKRMDGVKINGFYKKMWVPMTNAVLLTINTWESATRMGGISFGARDKDTCFFDPRAGFVMSGRRFVETYNLHGGWDLDDSMKVVRVKVFCSDPSILKLHLGKTVPATSPYVSNQKDAREMVLLVRSPNGPGEWSIEECDTSTLPIPEDLRHEDLTVVDLAKMPLPQDLLAASVSVAGMPTSTNYSREEMTRDDATSMIAAQVNNPGVGRFCNAMMVWAATNPGFPGHMLSFMEDVVDTCQQGFDATAFAAIAVEHDNIMEQVIDSGKPVDTALAFTRTSNLHRNDLRMTEGRFTRVQKAYRLAINTIKNDLQMHTLQMRAATPIVKAVQQMRFGADAFRWAENFYISNTRKFGIVDNMFNAHGETHPFKKMQIQYNHKIAMEEIVASMVAELQGVDQINILALWKYCTAITKTAPLGLSDRLIFQPNASGQLSVMDLLIEAIKDHGLLTD